MRRFSLTDVLVTNRKQLTGEQRPKTQTQKKSNRTAVIAPNKAPRFQSSYNNIPCDIFTNNGMHYLANSSFILLYHIVPSLLSLLAFRKQWKAHDYRYWGTVDAEILLGTSQKHKLSEYSLWICRLNSGESVKLAEPVYCLWQIG